MCGWINGTLVARLNIPSLVITIGTSFLFRGLELVLMNGTGVPLTADQYPMLHAIFREPVFGVPVQTLWMIAVAVALWVLLNRTRFGAHVFLVGDNPTSARLMGVDVVKVKTQAFILVGLIAVLAGIMTSVYGYYFWPTTGRRLPAQHHRIRLPRRHLGVRRHGVDRRAPSSRPTSSARSMRASSRRASMPSTRSSASGS